PAAMHRQNPRIFSWITVEILAEAGDTAPLTVALSALPAVMDVQDVGAPLAPGESVTVSVMADATFNRISVVAMLVPTNDAFVAVNAVDISGGSVTVRALAYDAGTEFNDELCAHIPGPASVCTGEGFNMSRDNAEGFVHVHRGIHGIGDLNASVYDWRNPVARVSISAMP
uniref:spondin domain-containing protein n=1 Tax=Candidatus Entotheonella palauensis TaxID=93172 RepID=UPI0015C41B44